MLQQAHLYRVGRPVAVDLVRALQMSLHHAWTDLEAIPISALILFDAFFVPRIVLAAHLKDKTDIFRFLL